MPLRPVVKLYNIVFNLCYQPDKSFSIDNNIIKLLEPKPITIGYCTIIFKHET